MFFGWKKRCRHLEAENAQLKAHSAQLEARLTGTTRNGGIYGCLCTTTLRIRANLVPVNLNQFWDCAVGIGTQRVKGGCRLPRGENRFFEKVGVWC